MRIKILKIIAFFMVGFLLGVLIGSIIFDFNPLSFKFGLKRHESVKYNPVYYNTGLPYTSERNKTTAELMGTTFEPINSTIPFLEDDEDNDGSGN